MNKLADLEKTAPVKSESSQSVVKPKDGEPCPCCKMVYYDPALDEGGKRAEAVLRRVLEGSDA